MIFPDSLLTLCALRCILGNCMLKNQRTEVRVKKGEIIDRALRRLKKKLDKEGTLKELRNRRHYEKPSEVKRREAKQRRR